MAQSPFHFVITGPESSGKSTLWNELKSHLDAEFIEEVARTYLEENGLEYERSDLKNIAFQQFQKQLEVSHSTKPFIISDTCLLTIAIWEEEKYGSVDNFTQEWLHLQNIDHYFLCAPDMPWTPDPQRENELDRHRLYDIYLEKIGNSSVPCTLLGGSPEERLRAALSVCNSFISS